MSASLLDSPVHVPSLADVAASRMTAFMHVCEAEAGVGFADHEAFHRFSVDDVRRFWSLFLRWSGLVHEGSPEPVFSGAGCEGATFFPDLRIGYTESALRIDDDADGDRPALTWLSGRGRRERYTRRELASKVARLSRALEGLGVMPGDHVVAVVHNDANAVIAALAVAALGATLSTASPDMGAFSILARFAPLAPSLLLCHLDADGSDGAGASGSLGAGICEIASGLVSLKTIIVLDNGSPLPAVELTIHRLSDLIEGVPSPVGPIAWRRFPFNQPLFIVFSSGTTGPPKCIVHGAGGTLLEHVKEHRLHCDLRPGDKLFFHTTCSWMMWNWQLSALASGAELVVYSGPVRGPETLWRIVSEEQVTVFGTSPAYLQACADMAFRPAELPLGALRSLLSTGSILHDHLYDWVTAHVGPLPLRSISGGTDIMGCFVLGNPNLPVFRGESQSRSLGMDVQAERGALPDPSSLVGELVCRTPFPSRPLGFYGDPDGTRFHAAYFAANHGVWTHGDLIEVTARDGARMHGRSDGVLNIHGIRVGPAEIHRILLGVREVAESLAVEQRHRGSAGESRLVLVVVLRPGSVLDGALKRRLRSELRRRGSPAHVPELILAVSALPTTHSGKTSERAVRDVVNDVDVVSAGAIANPSCLDELRQALSDSGHGAAPDGSLTAGISLLQAAVTAAWERVLDTAPVGNDEDFFDLGGTSMLALKLCNELRALTGKELSPALVLDAPTIAEMVATLTPRRTASARLVSLRSGRRRPVFFVHGLAGDTLELRGVARGIRTDRPVLGLQARGLDPDARPHGTVEAMAEDYVAVARARQPSGPYVLVGYSFGGLVAFEMARILHEQGERVELGLLDTNVHHRCVPVFERLSFRVLRKLHRVLARIPTLPSGPFAGARSLVARIIEARLHANTGSASMPPFQSAPMTPAMQRVVGHGFAAFAAYRPGRYDGAVTFFQADVRPPDYCFPVPIWAAATGGRLAICHVPGDHFTMIQEPNVGVLAERVGEWLDAT